MSAPNLDTLYKLQEPFETGVASVIEEATGARCETTFTTTQDSANPTPRIEVRVEVGDWTGHYGFDNANTPRPDAWRARVILTVVTNRNDASQDGTHAALVSETRSKLVQFGTLFTTDVLPYHAFTDLREQGAPASTVTEEDEDITEISYDALINIRADAWPEV